MIVQEPYKIFINSHFLHHYYSSFHLYIICPFQIHYCSYCSEQTSLLDQWRRIKIEVFILHYLFLSQYSSFINMNLGFWPFFPKYFFTHFIFFLNSGLVTTHFCLRKLLAFYLWKIILQCTEFQASNFFLSTLLIFHCTLFLLA